MVEYYYFFSNLYKIMFLTSINYWTLLIHFNIKFRIIQKINIRVMKTKLIHDYVEKIAPRSPILKNTFFIQRLPLNKRILQILSSFLNERSSTRKMSIDLLFFQFFSLWSVHYKHDRREKQFFSSFDHNNRHKKYL